MCFICTKTWRMIMGIPKLNNLVFDGVCTCKTFNISSLASVTKFAPPTSAFVTL